jgi:hypothetical protein
MMRKRDHPKKVRACRRNHRVKARHANLPYNARSTLLPKRVSRGWTQGSVADFGKYRSCSQSRILRTNRCMVGADSFVQEDTSGT